jgi:hypothetical protein
MPCGMNMDELAARMKARGVPGSAEAEKVLEQLLTADTEEPAETEGPQKPTEETGSERITT